MAVCTKELTVENGVSTVPVYGMAAFFLTYGGLEYLWKISDAVKDMMHIYETVQVALSVTQLVIVLETHGVEDADEGAWNKKRQGT